MNTVIEDLILLYIVHLHRTCSSSSVSCGQNGREVSAPGLKRNLWALIHDTPALILSNNNNNNKEDF